MMHTMFDVVSRGKLTVLLFHKVPVRRSALEATELDLESFEKILKVLHRVLRIIPLEDALRGLKNEKLPASAACITFDDGYSDWLGGVVPILEQKNIHATFFITTGQLDGPSIWNERILYSVANAPLNTPPLQLQIEDQWRFHFHNIEARQQTFIRLNQFLKYQTPEVKENLLQTLERHAGTQLDKVPAMTAKEVRELHSKGFGIGGHAITHPILSRCTAEQAYAEIGGAREALESLIAGNVTSFAYPNGVPRKDFGPEHIDMVKRAGYTSAVTTRHGTASKGSSIFEIPRFTPWGPSNAKMYLQVLRNFLQRHRALIEE